MTSPYTTQPIEAFMAAQTAVGLVLGAILWLRELRPRIATWLLLAAIALAVTAIGDGEFLAGIGFTVKPLHLQRTLKIAAALATLAAFVARRPLLAIVACLGEAALWKITDYIQEADGELAALHLAFFGLLIGIHCRTLPSDSVAVVERSSESIRGEWVDDVAAFVFGTAAGLVACRVLLHGWTNSGDEWANTFQAALFAKLRAYGSVPRCAEAFRSFWVFQYMGRSFSQYSPGWPLFMAPFVGIRAAWLAGPASLGLLAAGVSRLGRRAGASLDVGVRPPSPFQARWAGRFSAVALVLGSCALINGGSRYRTCSSRRCLRGLSRRSLRLPPQDSLRESNGHGGVRSAHVRPGCSRRVPATEACSASVCSPTSPTQSYVAASAGARSSRVASASPRWGGSPLSYCACRSASGSRQGTR